MYKTVRKLRNRPTYNILAGNPEGKRLIGISRRG
jgi:hypothetical protein